jgi:hypothetical protein
MSARWAVLPLVVVLLAGCSRKPARPPGTGAKEAALDFFDALVRQDWGRGHALLEPQSQASCPLERFSRLAAEHRRGLGFEPTGVVVRACEEQRDQAIAHVVLTGKAPSRARDAVTLRREADAWRVVLPATFGRQTGPPGKP